MELGSVWEFVKTGGVGAVFALMWFLERKRANELAQENKEMAKEVTKAMIETSNALTTLKSVLQGARQ
jgi:hypothetical protein